MAAELGERITVRVRIADQSPRTKSQANKKLSIAAFTLGARMRRIASSPLPYLLA